LISGEIKNAPCIKCHGAAVPKGEPKELLHKEVKRVTLAAARG